MTEQNSRSDINKTLEKSANIFPVVGVGASAGGLAAFKAFLQAIPEDSGMAYVLVQHLDPGHNSLLPELLQKATEIPVKEITDEVKVEPNTIYIIPSNKALMSNDGTLELSPRTDKTDKSLHLPIDLFFKSLAEVHGSHSIGVVLTGNGQDGTAGLKSIKEAGGITFAQETESAEYAAMPKSAITEGVVDFVLPPNEIPSKIIEVVERIYKNDGEEKQIQEEDGKVLKQILALLRVRKETNFTYYKQTTIRRRILRRMALSNNKSPLEYLNFLRENSSEQDVLHQDLLIPVTEFFRDMDVFSNLCAKVFPLIHEERKKDEAIRIWVAGCSTGQEAYSLAMCLLEFLGDGHSKEKIQIFATDISEKAIAKARSGIYKKSEMENLSSDRIKRFFNRVDSEYQIKKEVREMCVFAYHNFLQDPPFGKMNIITCRNVLIYMQPYLQKKALTTFHYALKKKGYLLLGKSETTSNAPDLFGPMEKKDKIFIRKDKRGNFMQVASRRNEDHFREFNNATKKENVRTDFQRTADDVILSKYTPAGVVIDEAMEIVHFRGRTGAYLEPQAGKPSLNLLRMAKTGLAFELRTIIHHVKKEQRALIKENIPLEEAEGQRFISIEAIPLPNLADPHFLILFHDPATDSRLSNIIRNSYKITADKEHTDERDLRIEQLEKDLAQAREDMRSITEDQEVTNEELQSANEELQSGSEELQTLNEELETSKEELQSTNEELISVNQELLGLNKNLTTARDFAVDILATVREPWVVLDKDLRIRSGNNTFYKTFNTNETEVEDKFLFDFKNKQWNTPRLRTLLEKILQEKSIISNYEITHDFPGLGERTMVINAREIRREEGGEKLILLVFGDITDRRIAEKSLEKSEIKFRLLAETIPQLMWITNQEGKFEYFNSKWNQYTGSTPGESVQDKWLNFVHPDDLHEVLETWNKSLQTGELFSMEYRLKSTEGVYNWFLAKALPLYNAEGEIVKWFGSYTNIELQKEAQEALKKNVEHFRELAELVPEKVTHADAEGNMVYYNKSWLDYTGLSHEELVKCGWMKLLHPDEKKEVQHKWKKSMKTGCKFETELRCIGRKGEYEWHLFRAVPVRDERGKIKQWIGATTQIENIKEEEKRKEGFLQLVSHELKTPVTSIKGYVQLLLRILEEEKNQSLNALPLKNSLERIDDQIGRLTRLISEMLDLSRIEDNRLQLKKENFSLNKLVEDTVQDISSTNTAHHINLHQELKYTINADKDRIGQVIINFITNAIKYSPENKGVEVIIHETEDHKVAVSVKDKGIGIGPLDQKEIFKRFHRVAGKNEETYSGLGIGLFLAHEIIERHKGTISLESELGKGSVFTFVLPYKQKFSSENS